ncbi:hypothetical protein D3C78_548760 [compost metagenome]
MKTTTMMHLNLLAAVLLANSAMAAVTADEAAKLGASLTPLGAEKAGNADGSIPAWTGGLASDAAAVENGFLSDPFPADKPLFVITAANASQYQDKLTAGQQAMFKRYPDSYRIPVYPTRRSAAAPQAVYDAAKRSAVTTEAVNDGYGLKNFEQSRYYAFPIPRNGVEVVWNHETRYRGSNGSQLVAQITPQTNGTYVVVQMEEIFAYPQLMNGVAPNQASNILGYFKQEVLAPARLSGTVVLIHETLDQVKEPRMAWAYNAGQRRVRRAPQIAYDGPGTAADGLRTADNGDMYNGSPDRYQWKLVGKKEMYIPYNNYRLWSSKLKYDDIIRPGHINQDLTRYELHRVWEVEGTVKPGERHIYAKRHMYFDEDTWNLVEVDHYDGRGQLWRVGEGYQALNYQQGASGYAAVALYDLVSGRYLVQNLINESKRGPAFDMQFSLTDFTPAALRNSGIR